MNEFRSILILKRTIIQSFTVCEEFYLSISLLASGYNSPFDRCCTFHLCGSFFTADLCVFQNKLIFGSGGAFRGLHKRGSA